jgi:hypothetical protein
MVTAKATGEEFKPVRHLRVIESQRHAPCFIIYSDTQDGFVLLLLLVLLLENVADCLAVDRQARARAREDRSALNGYSFPFPRPAGVTGVPFLADPLQIWQVVDKETCSSRSAHINSLGVSAFKHVINNWPYFFVGSQCLILFIFTCIPNTVSLMVQ